MTPLQPDHGRFLCVQRVSSPQVMKFPLASSKILGGTQPPRCRPCHITWPTDGGFNARFLQHRYSVDGTFNVLHENIPVQIKKAKSKFFRYLKVGNRNWDTKWSTAESVRALQALVSVGFHEQPSQRSGAEPELRHLHLDKGMTQQGRERTVASKSPPSPAFSSHFCCLCTSYRQTQREEAVLCFPHRPHGGWYLQEPGAEALRPVPTPPRWVPWKPASFPQKTSQPRSPPPRRWGLTHIHPRKGHRLGDGDTLRHHDHERLACSEKRGGGAEG